MKLQKIAIVGLLFFSIGIVGACTGAKKGACKECPEWTQKVPQNQPVTRVGLNA